MLIDNRKIFTPHQNETKPKEKTRLNAKQKNNKRKRVKYLVTVFMCSGFSLSEGVCIINGNLFKFFVNG